MRLILLSIIPVIASIVAGCGPSDPALDARASFEYFELCPSCDWQTHSIGDPFATGARGVIVVTNADRLPPFIVASSDDAVISFARDPLGSAIEAVAHAAGAARLILLDADGAEIGSLPIAVRDVARLDPVGHDEDRLLLMSGGAMTLELDPIDADGHRLFGHGAVDYTTDGELGLTSVRDSAPAIGSSEAFAFSSPEQVVVSASGALAASSVEAHAGTASLAWQVEVVDESTVRSVSLERDVGVFGLGTPRSATAHAFDASESEIHSPDCEWEIDPEELQDGVYPSRSSIAVDDSLEGVVRVTCTINGSSASESL